jgi:hypothetical protein
MLEIQLVLDTQTPEAMRVITNDNMSLLVSQINQLLNYIDTDFGSITGLSNLESAEVKIASNKLVISASSSTLNDNLELNGNLTLNGNLIRGNIYNTLINNQHPDVIANGGEYNIGNTTSYPIYSTYRVSSSDSGGLTVNLFPGAQGQEVFIVMSNDPSGVETFVKIQNSSSSNGDFYLPSSPTGLTGVVLDDIGEILHIKYINDGWVILSSTGEFE